MEDKFKIYCVDVETGLYVFNMKKFINIQNEIMKKYRIGNDFDFPTFDRYIGQIYEELQEVLTANDDERLEEIIDVLMYIGSTVSYIMEKDVIEVDPFTCITNNYNLSLDTFIKDLFVKVTTIRRLYPERKWHKPHNDENAEIYDLINRDKEGITVDVLEEMMHDIIKFVLSNYGDIKFVEVLSKKQNYIKSL